MDLERYADSAQAREGDKQSQREQLPIRETDHEAFFAACNARREAERVAFKARLATALDQMEMICGHRE